MQKPRDLMFAHLGAGLTVCDRNRMEHGDYQNVAHINADREVTYYKRVNSEDKAKIEAVAKHDDPNISSSQSQKVFRTRPTANASVVM